jgi:copper homeostasis protein
MIEVEICLNADDLSLLKQNVQAARDGGAGRIELCAHMAQEGLTPEMQAMDVARQAFGQQGTLLVMVRPRAGDFCYDDNELAQMQRSIQQAADCGAGGVVLGCLRADATVDSAVLQTLTAQAHQLGLKVTFHRAFDAVADPDTALDSLLDCGVDNVLSAGTPWGSGQAVVSGLGQLHRLMERAQGQIELVVGGGVNRTNVAGILAALPLQMGPLSVHSYSSVLDHTGAGQARVSTDKVRQLVQACRP